MFLNLFGWGLIAFGFCIWLAKPETWLWPGTLGPQFVLAFRTLLDAQPISTVACFFIGIACLMIKKKF